MNKKRHRGLIPRHDEPFEVVEKVGEVAYTFKLPERLKTHPMLCMLSESVFLRYG